MEDCGFYLPTISEKLLARFKTLSKELTGIIPSMNISEVLYHLQEAQKNRALQFSPAAFKQMVSKIMASAVLYEGDIIALFYRVDAIKEFCPNKAVEILKRILPIITSQRQPSKRRLYAVYLAAELAIIAGEEEITRLLDALQVYLDTSEDEDSKEKIYGSLGKLIGIVGSRHVVFKNLLGTAKKVGSVEECSLILTKIVIPLPNDDPFNVKYYSSDRRRKFTERYGLQESRFSRAVLPLTWSVMEIIEEKSGSRAKINPDTTSKYQWVNLSLNIIVVKGMVEVALDDVDEDVGDIETEIHHIDTLSNLLFAFDGIDEKVSGYVDRLQNFIVMCNTKADAVRESLYQELETSFYFFSDYVDVPIVSEEQFVALQKYKASSQEATLEIVKSGKVDLLSNLEGQKAEIEEIIDLKVKKADVINLLAQLAIFIPERDIRISVVEQLVGDYLSCAHPQVASTNSNLHKTRARELEEKRINKELANIRSKFKDPSLNGYQKKKYVCKLLYMYILGWEIDFGHMEAIHLLSSPKYTEKQIGYLAATLLFSENHDLSYLIVNAIANDLAGSNEVHCCLALHAIANIGGKQMAENLIQQVERLMVSSHHNAFVRKKAALCLLRLYRKFPDIFQAVDLAPRIIAKMDDSDLGVSLCISTLVVALAQQYPESYLDSIPKAISRLSQLVVDKSYTADYVYYKVPSPWLQVKLLRLLQYYPGIEDGSLERRLNQVISVILRSSQEVPKNVQHNNAQNAVLFEAINLAIHLDPNSELVKQAIALLATFISSKETNVRYLGLETMAHLAATGSDGCLEALKNSQDVIIGSLRDKDISVRRRALDVLYSMCDETNAREIVAELLNYLNIADYAMREEMVLKIAILAEKYAMEYSWYVDVILQLITVAGDHVSDEVWYRVIQIVTNNTDLQVYAVATILGALRTPSCHETAVKVGGYLLGEFGHLIANSPGCAPYDQFMALQSKFTICSPPTRALLLTTYLKFVNLFPEIRDEVLGVFRQLRGAMDVEIQQRASEYFSLSIPEAEELLQVICEEMPPFPERESALIMRLLKKIEDTEDKRIWVVGGRDANLEIARRETRRSLAVKKTVKKPEVLPSDIEKSLGMVSRPEPALASRAPIKTPSPEPIVESQQPAEPPEPVGPQFKLKPSPGYVPFAKPSNLNKLEPEIDLLGLGDSLVSSESLTKLDPDTPADATLYSKLLLTPNGLLHRDVTLEVGIKSEYHDNAGRIAVFFGNRSAYPITAFSTDIRTDPGFKLTLIQPVPATLPAGSQFNQVYDIECLSPPAVGPGGLLSPSMGISFLGGPSGAIPASIALKLPISVTKFTAPVDGLSPQDFFARWRQIGGPPRESQVMFKASKGSIDLAEIKNTARGLGFAILNGIDPSPSNITVAGISTCTAFGKVGCLGRIETSQEHKMIRVTIRTTNEAVTQNLIAQFQSSLEQL
ncbi:hypothetical protein HDU96_010461 [Phlyctochytrium bullatum]|nr:hypothetical protein HDU96_010461 [Phlyctochytrium bullatum]